MTELWDSRSYWNHLNAAPVGSITFWKGRETGRGDRRRRDKALGRVRHSRAAPGLCTRPPPLRPSPIPASRSPASGRIQPRLGIPQTQPHISRFPAHRQVPAGGRRGSPHRRPPPPWQGTRQSSSAIVPASPRHSRDNGAAPDFPSGR